MDNCVLNYKGDISNHIILRFVNVGTDDPTLVGRICFQNGNSISEGDLPFLSSLLCFPDRVYGICHQIAADAKVTETLEYFRPGGLRPDVSRVWYTVRGSFVKMLKPGSDIHFYFRNEPGDRSHWLTSNDLDLGRKHLKTYAPQIIGFVVTHKESYSETSAV